MEKRAAWPEADAAGKAALGWVRRRSAMTGDEPRLVVESGVVPPHPKKTTEWRAGFSPFQGAAAGPGSP